MLAKAQVTYIFSVKCVPLSNMSAAELRLCVLLEEHLGEIVAKVCKSLLENGSSTLHVILTKMKIPKQKVQKALCVLISHNIVTASVHPKGMVEYTADVKAVLLFARYPRYIYSAKTLYGDAGEVIVEELLHGGRMLMSVVIEKVTERLNKAMEGNQKVQPKLVKDKFVSLVNTHFLKRILTSDNKSEEDDKDESERPSSPSENLYRLPDCLHDIGTVRDKRKRKSEDTSNEPNAKKRRMSTQSEQEERIDENIYWTVNFERFHQHFRDQEIISVILRKNDKLASEIVRTILRISELTTDMSANTTTPISFHEILRNLPENLNIDQKLLEQYLKVLVDDQTNIVCKPSESSGGMYLIDTHKAASAICISNLESVVQERFGSKSFRIFKLLLLKKFLEQKQIESFALIPAKEAKELVYKMFAEGFVNVQEISKTPDHAPSRTYYPFTVNVTQLSRRVLERCYKSLANLISCRNCEIAENKRLLEKSQRVEVIAASFKNSGADETQIAEIEEMITPAERDQLTKFKARLVKLEQSELQLDEMIFNLTTYLSHECRPVMMKVKGKDQRKGAIR